MKLQSLLMVGAVIFCVSGCSTTDYSGSITRLNAAINDSALAIKAMDSDITRSRNELLKSNITKKIVNLTTKENSCHINAMDCKLIVQDKKSSVVAEYPIVTSIPAGVFVIEQLQIYVGNLKSIVEADTSDKVVASASSTLVSLETIDSQLKILTKKEPVQSTIADYKEPVLGVIRWITTKYVERVKKDALARATRQAQPVIEDLTEYYAVTERSLVSIKLAEAGKIFVDAQDAYDAKKTNSLLVSYVSAAPDYDSALKAKSAVPFNKFQEAHRKLKMQLNDEKATLKDVAESLSALEADVKVVKELVDSFNK